MKIFDWLEPAAAVGGAIGTFLGLRKKPSASAEASSGGVALAAGRDVNVSLPGARLLERPATVDLAQKIAGELAGLVRPLGRKPPITCHHRQRFDDSWARMEELNELGGAIWDHCTPKSAGDFRDDMGRIEGSMRQLRRSLIDHGGEQMTVDPDFFYTGAFLNHVGVTAEFIANYAVYAAGRLRLKRSGD